VRSSGLQSTPGLADGTCDIEPRGKTDIEPDIMRVKDDMATDEHVAAKPLPLAVVRKAIEESRGRAGNAPEGVCAVCGSATVETYSSLPWGTQVRLLVCPDVHCGTVRAVPHRQQDGTSPLRHEAQAASGPLLPPQHAG